MTIAARRHGRAGGSGRALDDPELDEAIATDGPVLIDFRVEREVNVFPMVPQNKSIGDMITSEAEA